ncbi:MAG TPA: FtsW/RodA/SpoVE family cell cycle protein [Candidatus Limnocylindrales bacterium]|nr:FtsW/RodA/SpoVE family cell cycle protein [Candidatus Limnocylindrales bacterium]
MIAMRRALFSVGIRPHLRWRELGLLTIVALTLVVGWASLQSFRSGQLEMGEASLLFTYLLAIFVIHTAFVITGRRMDEILFPTAAMLAGISLLLMERLPQDLVTQQILGRELGLADVQLAWTLLGFTVLAATAILVRSDGWLRRYKYTWAALGIGLLLLVFVFGEVTGGARLTLVIGPISGQPSELLKVILVVFLAGYLAENRSLLSSASTRVGPFRLPPLPYLLPMLALWGLALAIVIVQRDLGAALLYFLVFLGLLYVATRRASYVVLGLLLFLAGSAVLYLAFPHVQDRVDIWLNPFTDPQGAGYQVIRALYAYGRGGVLGTGLGAGLPQVGSVPSIPAIHTDFIFAALAEEMGMLGALGVLGLYVLIAQRGFRIAATAADDFRALLATGLTLVIVVQAAIIAGGNLRVVPLTGITLPFVSYGGSSLLVNGAVIGLLLALSDRGVEPPPPDQRTSMSSRIGRRARRAGGRLEEALS